MLARRVTAANEISPHRFLNAASTFANMARNDGFRQGLRELGYVEGKNINVEWRSAEGKADRLPSLAAELVGSG